MFVTKCGWHRKIFFPETPEIMGDLIKMNE